jgi:hypothetical protein
MSFLLDPFLAFMLGIIFSVLTRSLHLSSNLTFGISATAISLATLYSILLYLNIATTDFLILDAFAKFLPIEQQYGPRIMFHSNQTGVTEESFPEVVVGIFYALYFVWFYLGFRATRNVIAPHEPTPLKNGETQQYIRIGGLLVFVSAGMMLFFFTMIPLDKVVIGDALGAKSDMQDKEAVIKGYMATSSAKLSSFSDALCNPDKIGLEQRPPVIVSKDSAVNLLAGEVAPSNPTVSAADIMAMCESREMIGANVVFFFVNLSTWMFLIGVFMVSSAHFKRSAFWQYGKGE